MNARLIESPSPRGFFAGRGRHAAFGTLRFAQGRLFSPAEKRGGEGLSIAVIEYRRRSR